MSQSLANVLLHIVFSTKNRATFLKSSEVRDGLNAYMVGTLRQIDCPSLITNCVEDHLHCLCQLSRTTTISHLISAMKVESSAWVKTQDRDLAGFSWQNGYGAFSVSQSKVDEVRETLRTRKNTIAG
jgi:putative transposase